MAVFDNNGVGNIAEFKNGGVVKASIDPDGNFGGGINYVDHSIALSKLQEVLTATILGRSTAGTGDIQALTVAQVRTLITDSSNRFITDAERTAWNSPSGSTISDNSVTLAKLQQVVTARILGRSTTGTGNIEILTAAQVRSLITDSSNRFITDAERTAWNSPNGANIQAGTIPETALATAVQTKLNSINGANIQAGTIPKAALATAVQTAIDNASAGTVTSVTIGSKFKLEYNSTDNSLDFTYLG